MAAVAYCTDRRTDRNYQIHYLPASQSVKGREGGRERERQFREISASPVRNWHEVNIMILRLDLTHETFDLDPCDLWPWPMVSFFFLEDIFSSDFYSSSCPYIQTDAKVGWLIYVKQVSSCMRPYSKPFSLKGVKGIACCSTGLILWETQVVLGKDINVSLVGCFWVEPRTTVTSRPV